MPGRACSSHRLTSSDEMTRQTGHQDPDWQIKRHLYWWKRFHEFQQCIPPRWEIKDLIGMGDRINMQNWKKNILNLKINTLVYDVINNTK